MTLAVILIFCVLAIFVMVINDSKPTRQYQKAGRGSTSYQSGGDTYIESSCSDSLCD